MKPNFSLVFDNPLLQSEIFSYLDTQNLVNSRIVCSKWAEDTESILSKRDRYFSLNSSTWFNRESVRDFNGMKLKWMDKCLKGGNKFWLLNSVEFPIREILQWKNIRDFFEKHGHLIKNLRLVKYEKIGKPRFVLSKECYSPFHLLHLILTSWCPNLTSLSILDTPTEEEHDTFPEFVPQDPYFKEKLKLENLTLDFGIMINFNRLLANNIPISYRKEIILNCPNLKSAGGNWIRELDVNELFFQDAENYGHCNLETLEVTMHFKDAVYLKKITVESFPKLKALDIVFYIEDNFPEEYFGVLNHPGVKTLTIRTGTINIAQEFHGFTYFETILNLAPHAKAINIVYGSEKIILLKERYPATIDFSSIGEFCCKILTNTYPNIERFEVDASIWINVVDVVHIFGTACPNLKLFKIKWIAKEREEEELRIKAVVQEIIDTMENVRHFEIELWGPLWKDLEWEELSGHLNTKLEKARGKYLRFYFGSEDYLKSRTRFHWP